jgi:hypothetical protein
MSLMNLSVKHGRTQEEARARLEMAVNEVTRKFGPMVHRVEWSDDRDRVKLEGGGFRAEIWVDALEVHATGDIALLGNLLGSPLAAGLKQIVQQAFRTKLP